MALGPPGRHRLGRLPAGGPGRGHPALCLRRRGRAAGLSGGRRAALPGRGPGPRRPAAGARRAVCPPGPGAGKDPAAGRPLEADRAGPGRHSGDHLLRRPGRHGAGLWAVSGAAQPVYPGPPGGGGPVHLPAGGAGAGGADGAVLCGVRLGAHPPGGGGQPDLCHPLCGDGVGHPQRRHRRGGQGPVEGRRGAGLWPGRGFLPGHPAPGRRGKS